LLLKASSSKTWWPAEEELAGSPVILVVGHAVLNHALGNAEEGIGKNV